MDLRSLVFRLAVELGYELLADVDDDARAEIAGIAAGEGSQSELERRAAAVEEEGGDEAEQAARLVRFLEYCQEIYESWPAFGVDRDSFSVSLEVEPMPPLRELKPWCDTILVRSRPGELAVVLICTKGIDAELDLEQLRRTARDCVAYVLEHADGKPKKGHVTVRFDVMLLGLAATDPAERSRLAAMVRSVPGRERLVVIPWGIDAASGSVWTPARLGSLGLRLWLRRRLRSSRSEAAILEDVERRLVRLQWLLTAMIVIVVATLALRIWSEFQE